MTERTASTERLRKLLDERGIEHFDYDKGGRTQTQWEAPDGKRYFTYGTYNNPAKTAKLVISWFPTPEQAIAATLGNGECEIETTESWLPAERYHRCKHCGAFFAVMDASGDIPPCVCPNCGKAVKR